MQTRCWIWALYIASGGSWIRTRSKQSKDTSKCSIISSSGTWYVAFAVKLPNVSETKVIRKCAQQCIWSYSVSSLTCNPVLHVKMQISIGWAKHNKKGRRRTQTRNRRLESKTTPYLRSNTMLSYRLSPKLRPLENGSNNLYQATQQLYHRWKMLLDLV